MVPTNSFDFSRVARRVVALLTLLLTCFNLVATAEPVSTAFSTTPTGQGATLSLGSHYLLLVNTAIARQLKPQDISVFDKSPYDGLAIAFHYNYDTAPVFSSESMSAQLREWKSLTRKDLWPWVYFNRMLGAAEAATNERVDVPYFHKIHGIDLDDQAGARTDFMQIWKSNLRVASEVQSPGIVFDPEFYNDHKAYDPAEMARETGKSPDQLVSQLEKLGADMADSASSQYPNAVLWFCFTGFSHKDFKTINGKSYYPTPVYIAIGLLDRIQKRGYALRVVSGGEGSIGYCHENLATFREAVERRAAAFAPIVKKYDGILELAGTLTLWDDRANKSGFVGEGDCAKASALTIEDLEPYLELMMHTYRFNWIYGSTNGGYFAFDPQKNNRIHKVIGNARARTNSRRSN
jgi:hypothetical protein